jgi:hypothetical protein
MVCLYVSWPAVGCQNSRIPPSRSTTPCASHNSRKSRLASSSSSTICFTGGLSTAFPQSARNSATSRLARSGQSMTKLRAAGFVNMYRRRLGFRASRSWSSHPTNSCAAAVFQAITFVPRSSSRPAFESFPRPQTHRFPHLRRTPLTGCLAGRPCRPA